MNVEHASKHTGLRGLHCAQETLKSQQRRTPQCEQCNGICLCEGEGQWKLLTETVQQAKIMQNGAKTQNHYMGPNQQSEITKEEQLLQKEMRKMCCLDNQSNLN